MSVVASTTVFDSLLFRDAFGTERMRAVFSDLAPAMVDRVLEARSALSP
jgi:3-carboxy-cis,cis-muconate cycloisomerase